MASEPTPVVSFENKRTQQSFSMEQKQKAIPAYTVEPMKRKTIVNRTVKDEIGFRVVPTEIEVEGYMVRTLRGDSAFLSQGDLERLKLDRNLVPLYMEGGDDTVVGVQQQSAALSNKQKQTLDVLTQLLEKDPKLLDKMLAVSGEQVEQDVFKQEDK
jgi:hypothetical protein